MSDLDFDVIVIGRGPVGLCMTAMLAQGGHRVALVERHRDLYGLPRAGHIDHEIVRILQSLGAAEPVLADSYPTTEYVWKNATGETLLEFDWGAKGVSGYNSDFMYFQPVMERALSERVAAQSTVADYSGWELEKLQSEGGGVAVTLRKTLVVPGQTRPTPGDEVQVLHGRYLVAADGANSAIRKALGIEREDLGFNERWLVVDVFKKRDFALDFDCGQICDPARPITVLPLGKRHRRWEWAMLPGETVEDLERPETAWRLLAQWNVTPDDAQIVRQLVYTFEARLATTWRQGGVFLMGDACHTMPPFMGQGMCSGIRDAKNLAWKLDLVLRGVSGEALLETYQLERLPHARDWTVISLEAGKIPCTLDPEVARERDAKFRAGWMPPLPNFPKLEAGILDTNEASRPLAGQLALQGRVERAGMIGLFDNLIPPHGFSVISIAEDPRTVLSEEQMARLGRLPTTFARIGSVGDASADVIDIDGTYADYFHRHGVAAVVNRPDFYVFGAVASARDLPALADRLIAQLGIDRESSMQPAAPDTARAEKVA